MVMFLFKNEKKKKVLIFRGFFYLFLDLAATYEEEEGEGLEGKTQQDGPEQEVVRSRGTPSKRKNDIFTVSPSTSKRGRIIGVVSDTACKRTPLKKRKVILSIFFVTYCIMKIIMKKKQ